MKVKNSVVEHPSKDFIIKRKDIEFLKAVNSYDGEATTSEIRQQSGLNLNQINHRYQRLEEAEFISVDRADEGCGAGSPPKIAILTESGRETLQIGEENDIVDYETSPREVIDDIQDVIEEIRRRVDGLSTRHDRVEQRIAEAPQSADTLRSELEYISEWMNVAEKKIGRMESELDELRRKVEE